MEIILLVIIIVLFFDRKKKSTNVHEQPKNEFYNQEIEDGLNEADKLLQNIQYIKNAYAPKWMFTQNEKRAYYKLNSIAKKQGNMVFAKVRLFDLVTPKKDHPKYKTNLWKIQAKHVDFVITKENLVAKYIIELDDNSHDNAERKARDQFVDNVLTACGYKVLHTREIQEEEITRFLSD